MLAEQPPKLSFAGRTTAFVQEVRGEMAKVTWPEWPQVRQLSIGVIVLALLIGLVIWIMDIALQFLLVTVPLKLFPG